MVHDYVRIFSWTTEGKFLYRGGRNDRRKAMMSTAAPAPTDLKSTLEEMRASVAAECRRKGLALAIQEAILGLLACLMAMFADFQAGRLGAAVEAAPAPALPPVPGQGSVSPEGGKETGASACEPAARSARRRAACATADTRAGAAPLCCLRLAEYSPPGARRSAEVRDRPGGGSRGGGTGLACAGLFRCTIGAACAAVRKDFSKAGFYRNEMHAPMGWSAQP
jgi:hypothetical protein